MPRPNLRLRVGVGGPGTLARAGRLVHEQPGAGDRRQLDADGNVLIMHGERRA